MNKLLLPCIFVGVFLVSGAAQATNLVVNGSFEGTTYVGDYGDLLPTGWRLSPPTPVTLSRCNIDSATDASVGLGPQDGSHYVRFQAASTNKTRDCFYQYIPTTAGQQYTVSFWVAMTSTSVSNYSGLDPVWDEPHANNVTHMGKDQFYYAPTNTGPVPYQFFSFTVTAATNTNQTQLMFHGIDSNGSILLDNVSVEPLVVVTNPPAIAPSLSGVAVTNHQFSFTLTGTAGSNYIVQAATNLAAPGWISLRTNSAPFSFIESNADLYTRRFYRGLVGP